MGALKLGLIAALCWGVHDTLVRYVSQQLGVFPSLFPVLVTGTVMSAGLAIALDTEGMTMQAGWLAILSGMAFGVTGLSFYKALAIGPVRLVAPIVASFPILSVGWAVIDGQSVSLWQWAAVLIIVGGCGFVAMTSKESDSSGSRISAVIWSALAAIGFATSFALGQHSMGEGTEMMAIAMARAGAVAVVGLLALVLRQSVMPVRSALPILIIMGVLDAMAIGAVMLAGNFAFPAFASVAASTFGVLTIILAAVFLKEAVARVQWIGIAAVFLAVGYLAI